MDYLKTLKEGFPSEEAAEKAKLELAQSIRDRGSRDQDEHERCIREVINELRERNAGSEMITDITECMELSIGLSRGGEIANG